MNRFFLDIDNVGLNDFFIDDVEAVKHISKVLRLRTGDSIIGICSPLGEKYLGDISHVDKSYIKCEIKSKEKLEKESFELHLFQGVPKGSKLEYIIQKNVELGVNCIHPIIMDRTIGNRKDGNKKLDRYIKISESAAKQANRNYIPTVEEYIDFSKMIEMLDDFDIVVFPYENEKEHSIKDFLRGEMQNISKESDLKVAVIIGAEGGFSEEEVKVLKKIGLKPVTLGKSILRTETAGLVVSAMIKYELEL